LKQDEVFEMRTAGGGGWGDPAKRDPGAIERDLRDEKISPEHAREAYGYLAGSADEETPRISRPRTESGKR
jgi:N-methylhydantoinase B